MRRLIAALVVMAFSIPAFAASLDGTQWRVEITPQGATVPHHIDRVRFEDGKLTSALFQRKGFAPAAYTSSKKDETTAWQAEQKTEASTLSWKGEILGEALTGSLVLKDAEGKTVMHALVGSPAVEEPTETAPTADGKTATTDGGKKKSWGCSLIIPPSLDAE